MARRIIIERLPADHPDIARAPNGDLIDWVAYRADSYDWEPRGAGVTPAEAEMSLDEAEADAMWDAE